MKIPKSFPELKNLLILKTKPLLLELRSGKLEHKKLLTVCIISFAVFYLDYALIISAQQRGLRATAKRISSLRAEIKKTRTDLGRLEEIKKAALTSSNQARKRIASDEEIVLLLSEIAGLANKADIKIIKVKPEKGSVVSTAGTTQGKFLPVTIYLDVVCKYHSLAGFINRLENFERFVSVEEIKIARQQSDNFTENATLKLLTYVRM